jgi:transposase
MYFDSTVPIPSDHVVRIKKDSIIYIYYEYGRKYDKDRGYNSAKRACIGKQSTTDCNLMYPNQNFRKHFPEYELPQDCSSVSRSCCLKIGTYLVIDKIVKSFEIPKMINTILGEKDGSLFLDFAAYSIITEGNAAQYYPDYAYNHALFTQGMKIFSDSKISSLLSQMPESTSSLFLAKWNENMDHRKKIYISYDATNKNSQAGDLEIVEYGHPKDDQGLPVFGYSIAYDSTNSIPLFYEQYPGSIVDISQLEFMLSKAQAYGYRSATFILDRGYFSKSNIMEMESKGYSFILMVKGMNKLVNSIIEEKKNSFESSRECYIRRYETYGTTVKCKLYADDTKDRYIHLYHSNQRRAAESMVLETKLNKMMDAMDKFKGSRYVFQKSFLNYFELTYDNDGTFLMYEERQGVVERELNTCGYFCIVTSEKMTAKQALEIYKSRDENEKLFRGDKSYLGNKSMRVYSDRSTTSKILIEFVALIIRCRFYTYIKDTFKDMVVKPNYATVPAAIRELEKIEMSRDYDGIYRLDHAVTKKQKDILKCFGLDADMVKQSSIEISKQLREKEAI